MHRGLSRISQVWRRSSFFQFVTLAVLIFGSRSVIADWNYVPTGSMKPTILEGDAVFVNRMAYDVRVPFSRISVWHRGDPKRGEVVILHSPEDEKRLVKRVVGLPGDIVAMQAGQLIVNGEPLRYQPAKPETQAVLPQPTQQDHVFVTETLGEHAHAVMLSRQPWRQGDFGSVSVPAGHYFVLGDHRDNSADSRYFGFVARHRIVGQAVGVLVSFDQDRNFVPRWDRFFSTMR